MTRQEAIAILERLQEPEAWEPQISENAYTALQMAIDALNDVTDRNVGDTISRQVVLNEIEEWISALYENAHRESASDGKLILNAIKHLPSAQPEPEDCDTCKHGYFGGEECNNCRVRFPNHYERRTDEQTG